MTHPASCRDPNCALTYREHLLTINVSATAIPNRAVTRSKSENDQVIIPDEPTTQTLIREKRWERDNEAYKRLHKQGLRPPHVDGSALRERQATTRYDVERRPVTIDYTDPK